MKAIQYLINSVLPEDIRDYTRTYDAKSMNELQSVIAEKYPERYRELMDKIMDIARKSVYYSGQTLRLSDFKPPFDKDAALEEMHNEVQYLRDNIKDEEKKNKAIMDVYERYATKLEKDTLNAAKTNRNNLYNSVSSGARGSPFQLKALITTPALYTDYKGKTIPYFVKHSFGEGLSIPEYLASTYGTRAATIAIKKSTAKFGGWGKSLFRPVSNMMITSKKDTSNNGIDLDIDDASLYGRVLARPVAGYAEGTIVDRDVLNSLKSKGVKTVIVHSPIATVSAEGISAEAFGLDYNKRLPKVGDFHAGITAATATSEPAIQGGLCLHYTTEIMLWDGTKKQIRDIVQGRDIVKSLDTNGNIIAAKVLNKFKQGCRNVYEVIFEHNDIAYSVICTRNHKFKIYGEMLDLPVKEIYKKSLCFDVLGDPARILDIRFLGNRVCFDIEVDSPTHLFVLANGLISHNSSKHEAGGFKGKKRTFSGFDYINQFFESPEQYKSKAPLAESDGRVEKIYEAPQGGHYIVVNGVEHYVDPDSNIEVQEGQDVEQGDQLADGLVDLGDVVRLRGLGEGRKAFVNIGKQLLDDSNATAHKRNLEVLARGIVDKVEITDPDSVGDYLPGDIVSYNALEASYKPDKDSKEVDISSKNKDLKGKYLQKPVLHYTIGTKLTNKMIDHIRKTGITDTLLVSDNEPGFTPIYVRLKEAPNKGNRNFLERATAPYQAKNYVESAVRGYKTNIKSNLDPFVRMSMPDFAENTDITGRF